MSDQELSLEHEDDETPYVEFDISVSPSDPPLSTISQQIEDGDIIIPFYQRKFVWTIQQASKLIESFLMGLPVPQVFLYQNDEGILEVIDGQQRLMSVQYFFSGFFGEADRQGKRQVFKLKGLSERSEYNNKTFSELSSRDQRRLKSSTIRAINIRQLSPKGGADSVFHIFERLNTGGTQLKPQEIRNAVYRGPVVKSLRRLNSDTNWQSILGLKSPDKTQKDVELVLRLASLFRSWQNYEKPMLRHLNTFMRKARDWNFDWIPDFENEFLRVTALVAESLVKPFRPKRVINAAVLEAVFIAMLEDPSIDKSKLQRNYDSLFDDHEFKQSITGATTDTATLRQRINRAKDILSK